MKLKHIDKMVPFFGPPCKLHCL